MAQLLVIAGDGSERTIELGASPVSFGRQDECDVVLEEIKASRMHCTFRPWRSGWRVVDEGSSNGTWLGGKPVLSARLQPGDEVEIGDTLITFAAAASEMPKAETIRQRRVRKAQMPWGAVVGAVVLAGAALAASSKMIGGYEAEARESYRLAAKAEIDRAGTAPNDAAYRNVLSEAATAFSADPLAADALKTISAASAQGAPARPATETSPEWKRSLDRLEQSRARTTTGERRNNLRSLLVRNLSEPAAVAAIAGALVSDERSARERATAELARLREDALSSAQEGRLGHAIEAWIAWRAAASTATRAEEAEVATTIASLRELAQADAMKSLELHSAQLADGRIAAAQSIADTAVARLTGSGYDAVVRARTARSADPAGGSGADVPGGGAKQPTVSETERLAALLRQKIDRALRSAEELTRTRQFADAAVLLREAAADIADGAMRAEVDGRIGDLSSEADFVTALFQQVADDVPRFGSIPVAGGTAKVISARPEVIVVEVKGQAKELPLATLPGATLIALIEKAKLEPPQIVAAALVLHDIGEDQAFRQWMRKALLDKSLQVDASAVYARIRGEKLPQGGYLAHPKDPQAIITYDEHRRIENEGKITELSAKLVKVIEKLDLTKQAKAVAKVEESYQKLEAARAHALELIFDEAKYFYPYKNRMREYAPVSHEVDERVKAVREVWDDKSVAKVRADSALTKILEDAENLRTDIEFYGGTCEAAAAKLDGVKRFLGKDITVQNYFANEVDLALLEYNDQMLDANAKVKMDVTDGEREQIRITNEYRRMMGHRRMLRIHEKLVASARGHSTDMATLGFFDHFSPVAGKNSPMDRMLLAGYPNTPCSENIAIAGGDPMSAFEGWAHSSGHHRNMLNPDWSELGTGQSGRHWTQNFGFSAGDDQVGRAGPR